MTVSETSSEALLDPPIAAVVSRFVAHAQGYHVRCSRCGAVSVTSAAHDALRSHCPSCSRRLTIPATTTAPCPVCHRENEYPHNLAGHSAGCNHCNSILTLGPLIGRAESRRRMHRSRSSRHHGQRTLAFTDGAERSLFILAAAVATLIFLIVTSL